MTVLYVAVAGALGGAGIPCWTAWLERDEVTGGFAVIEHDGSPSEPELVELGCCIALTFGQQSWIRLLGIDHHEYLAGTDASMAPGFGTAEELAESKARPDYWAASRT